MMDNKWRDIASAINSLAKGTPFSTEKNPRNNGLMLVAGRNVMLRYLKKKQVVPEGSKPNSKTNGTLF